MKREVIGWVFILAFSALGYYLIHFNYGLSESEEQTYRYFGTGLTVFALAWLWANRERR